MAKSNFSLAKLSLLIIFVLISGALILIIQWVLDQIGSNLLKIYSRPSKLSYLWYSNRDETHDCNNCRNISITVSYPLEHDGILAVGSQLIWELKSDYLLHDKKSETIQKLQKLVEQENNATGLTLQPCIRSAVYLDHAMQYWQSNSYNVFFLMPQKEDTMTLRVPPIDVFNLLDHPASYTFEVSASLGFCHLEQVQKLLSDAVDTAVVFFEPKDESRRISVRQQRPFYSLQFHPTNDAENSASSPIPPPRFSDGSVILYATEAVPSQPPEISQADDMISSSLSSSNSISNSEPLAAIKTVSASGIVSPASFSSPLDVITATATVISASGTATITSASSSSPNLFQTTTESPSLFSPTVKDLSSIPIIPAAITKILLSKRATRDSTMNIPSEHANKDENLLKTLLYSSSSPIHILSHRIQLPYDDMPRLTRTRKVYIDYPPPMSQVRQNGSWNLALSFPLAFLQVPTLQLCAMVDGTLYTISLGQDMASLLQQDFELGSQLKENWIESTREFIKFVSQVEYQQLVKDHPIAAEATLTPVSVEDFYPSFLEMQIYQQSLFGELRQLNIVTLPELSEGWHQIDIYAVVKPRYLREKLLASLPPESKASMTMDEINDDRASVIVAFDSLRIQVIR